MNTYLLVELINREDLVKKFLSGLDEVKELKLCQLEGSLEVI